MCHPLKEVIHKAILATMLGLLFLQIPNSMAASATVAVASNFQRTFTALATEFKRQSNHDLRAIISSTGVLFNQITHGAPFDVLLAADSLHPIKLEKKGFAVSGSRFTYGLGRLALVLFSQTKQSTRKDVVVNKQRYIDQLAATTGKIAIANPKIAPYGIAAKQTLEYLRMWQSVQPRIVMGANIAQSFQFVATGNAESGFSALSQALANETSLSYWTVPIDWHQPILQQAILLQSGKNNVAAIDFLAFLKKQIAITIIKSHGYNIP